MQDPADRQAFVDIRQYAVAKYPPIKIPMPPIHKAFLRVQGLQDTESERRRAIALVQARRASHSARKRPSGLRSQQASDTD